MFQNDLISFPSQKKSTKDKFKNDQEWFKKNIDACEAQSLYYGGEEHRKMEIYNDLDNGVLNQSEMEKAFNPLGLSLDSFPATLKNYSLTVPKVDLLQGEETRRKFDWTIRARNLDGDSSEQDELIDMFMSIVIEEIQKEGSDEQKIKERIDEFANFVKYSWKDLNERTATRILQYLWRQQDLQIKFNDGIREVFKYGKEIYRIDDEGSEPIAKLCDARDVYVIRKGKSKYIEDAEAISEITYEPINQVIDSFYDYLSETDVSELEDGSSHGSKSRNKTSNILNYGEKQPSIYSNLDFGNGEGFLNITEFNNGSDGIGLPYDAEGNIRVVRARWIGRKKIGILDYMDENGNELERIVSEHYKPNKELGETVKWIWINESYEGVKLGLDKYVKMQVRKVQMRHFDNKSRCFLGYVGTDYGQGLLERMESYQYAFNIYMTRLELIMSKYKGPIYEIDINKIPDDWEPEEWFYYADVLGWAVLDNFNEGKRGASTGKLAGGMNNANKVLDANVGNYIQQIVTMLQYIEKQVGDIAGVSEAREGQSHSRETAQGIESSVTQSNYKTERWFFLHDETKKRVMNALLDTAKQLWKNSKSKKLNFVLDDLSRQFIKFNGEDLAASEFDLFTTNSSEDAELRQTLKQLTHASVQNGGSMSTVIDVLRADSITEMARKIEMAEEEMNRRNQEEQEQQRASAEKIAQMANEDKQKERDLKKYAIDTEIEFKYVELGQRDEGETILEDNSEPETPEFDKQKHRDEMNLKNRQANETVRHNKETEKISKIKKPTAK